MTAVNCSDTYLPILESVLMITQKIINFCISHILQKLDWTEPIDFLIFDYKSYGTVVLDTHIFSSTETNRFQANLIRC